MPTVPPLLMPPAISRAAASGATTGLAWSWARAVVVNNSVQSATACSTVSNSFAWSRIWSAPAAARCALRFGQPSRGLTIRSRVSAKLTIARAAMPIFSPSCGSTRMITVPAKSKGDLVISVPEPDISLHFLIQVLKTLNQAPNNLIQRLNRRPLFRWPALRKFSSNIIGLAPFFHARSKPQCGLPRPLFPVNFRQYRLLQLFDAVQDTAFSSKSMARLFCHDHPEPLVVETDIVDARPGRVLLAQSPFYPGGGGQLADRGILRWSGGEAAIVGFESAGGRLWHLLADPAEPGGTVQAAVDPAFRQMMRELHTDTHILNALVFQSFNGALVTGVQMNEDGTARMDFDLPEARQERLRALEAPINDMIRQNLTVRDQYIPADEAHDQPGLSRSKSVAPPPTPDGKIRIVEIVGLDRQACGGTHLGSTGASRGLRILKIENKGRHNRRLRIALEGSVFMTVFAS